MAKTKEKETPKRPEPETTRQSLEVEAYFHWLERGCPIGDDLTDWVEVEKKYVATARHN